MTTKKTTQKKTTKPPAKKKPVKKAEPFECVTEYDYSIAESLSPSKNKELRRMYFRMSLTYFKLWINSFL